MRRPLLALLFALCAGWQACSDEAQGELCVPQCEGLECGDDGCGGSCGICPQVAPYCVANLCAVTCTPQCAGRECGDDGCGGSCGECAAPQSLCDPYGACVSDASADTGASRGSQRDIGPTTPVTLRLFLPSAAPEPMAGVGRLVIRYQFEDGSEEVARATPYALGQLEYPSDLPVGMSSAPTRLVVEGWSINDQGEFGYLLAIGRHPLSPGIGAGALLSVKMARINHFTPLIASDSDTPQSLDSGRIGHSLTHSREGETLIIGGSVTDGVGASWWTSSSGATSTTSVARISPETWALSGDLSLSIPRAFHAATESLKGDIFITGGFSSAEHHGSLCAAGTEGSEGSVCAVEWYDPGQGFALLEAPLGKARAGQSAIVIDDTPTLLLVGGDGDAEGTWELWDPVNGSRGPEPLPDGVSRRFAAAVHAPIRDDNGVAQDGVIIFGGESESGALDTGLFFVVEGALMLQHPTPLPKGARTHLSGSYVESQGYIYFIGGFEALDGTSASSAIDVYDTRAMNWQEPFLSGLEGFNLNAARGAHSASVVEETRIVVLGGSDGTKALERTEIVFAYDPGDGLPVTVDLMSSCVSEGCTSRVPTMDSARVGHRAVVDSWGDILIVGGAEQADGSQMTEAITLFTPQ